MRPFFALTFLVLLAGCSSTSYESARSIPFLHSLDAVPRPYSVIGKIETRDKTHESVYITRQRIQEIALSADADAVLIANINPLPDEPVFYTAPSDSLNLEDVWLFELIQVEQSDGSYQTVTTVPSHGDMPLTAVFIRYLD